MLYTSKDREIKPIRTYRIVNAVLKLIAGILESASLMAASVVPSSTGALKSSKLNTVHSLSLTTFSDEYNGTSIIGIVTESTIVTIR